MTGNGGETLWRPAIDALVFQPPGHQGFCAVHRLAFRALLGRAALGQPGRPEECLAFFAAHRSAFERAAAAKIQRRGLGVAASLHLTSRDVARALANLS